LSSVNVNTKLISDAQTLTANILVTSKDSIEREQHRPLVRSCAAVSSIAGALFSRYMWGNAYGMGLLSSVVPSVLFQTIHMDAALVDRFKLEKINGKLFELDTVELDKADPNYEKAIAARDFQKEVYSKVKDYTATAQAIKGLTSLGIALFGTGLFFSAMAQVCPEDATQSILCPFITSWTEPAAQIIMATGLAVAVPAAALNIYHWATKGSKLDSIKKTLATQICPTLFASNKAAAKASCEELPAISKEAPQPLSEESQTTPASAAA
jgi:hypothetical protein